MINKEKLTVYGILGGLTIISGTIGGALTAVIMTKSNIANKKAIAVNENKNEIFKNEIYESLNKYSADFESSIEILAKSNDVIEESITRAKDTITKVAEAENKATENISNELKKITNDSIIKIQQEGNRIFAETNEHFEKNKQKYWEEK